MTRNGIEAPGRGYRDGGRSGGGSGYRAAGKANPPRYREDEVGRASSSSNQRSGASVRTSGGSYNNLTGNATHHDDHLDDDGNIAGEVDYTDGEMGSASSSFASSPQSSVGSGGDRRGLPRGANGAGSSGSSSSINVSNQNGVRNNKNESSSPGASFSPSPSSSNGATRGGRGGGSGGGRSDGVQPIPGVSSRPAGVPFGASALSKTMPNTGRGRPRGLRPRSSGSAGTPGSASSRGQRVPPFSALGRQQGSSGTGTGGGNVNSNALARRRGANGLAEAEARAAELLAPGVPLEVVVRAAIKIESVMRVLIARGYVRRKLVSEVTAFSLIMERGIEVIKHPFSGKAKPKNVTVNFVSRKGAMQLSWGGKSGVPLETIFGVTKGIQTDEAPLTASQLLATRGMTKRLNLSKKLSAANKDTGPLKGKRFDLMALPMDPGQQDRRERGASEHAETPPKRTQGMSISIGAGYDLPEEKHRARTREEDGAGQESERIAVVDDLNDKLQSLRKLCVPQARPGSYRPGRAPKTMAVKHMAFFQGGSGSVKSGAGLGSVADMWGDGVRRQYQTDMVRQSNQSVEDVHKRDSVRTAMLVTRSGVHRVTRKAGPPESR
eukprot:g14699.t1